jgi:glycosyltransferase involved in cell wall biosynthesis
MKILVLTNFYPPHELGGMGQSCQQVVEGLVQRGHTVGVLTSMNGTNNIPIREGIVRRSLFLEMDFEPWLQAFKFFLNRKKRERLNLQRFDESTREVEPDLIFIWGMWNLPRSIAALAEANFPGRVVYRFADYWPTLPSQYAMYWQKEGRSWFSRVPKFLLGILARGLLIFDTLPKLEFVHAICVSAATRDALVRAGIPIGNARVIHTGMESSGWLRKENQFRKPGETGSLKLLYAGRLAPTKGIEIAIEAMKLLVVDRGMSSIFLDLAGSGAEGYIKQLKNKVAHLGLENQVHFLGRFPPEEMPGLMHQYNVLLVPSTWEEPFSRAMLEGMAAGLVVIGTPMGGTKEIIRNGENGILVEPGNVDDLARAIQKLAGDPELQIALAESGQKTVTEEFAVERMMIEIESYLQEVIDSITPAPVRQLESLKAA